MKLAHVLTLPLATLALAACNNSDDAAPAEEVAAPEPELTPAPVATAAEDGTALMAGTWNVRETPEGGSAVFGEEGAAPALSFNCDAMSGTVTLDVASSSQTPEAWRVDAGGEAARLDMAPVEGGLSAEIEPGLAIFHAFSTTGQVVSLTNATGEKMQFPTHPGISRVLDACS
ncbi:hypothetical protein GCM10023208_12860 [Erythrobacter westpacificensis]|uniref:Alkaline proteinase inhibitor/ Outer membrane lipoprotein Omp19 domain-containing protein n=2 Tax=Erythrobacter westpacificensis TaxID=1055231 RepID=A0ABP9K8Q1_9SPHN